jgi:hypothetical protein
MKVFLRAATTTIALATTALLTIPAVAQQQQQQNDGVDGFGHAIKAKPEYHQPARNEAAYSDALKRIPDAKEKADPWGAVREKPPSK